MPLPPPSLVQGPGAAANSGGGGPGAAGLRATGAAALPPVPVAPPPPAPPSSPPTLISSTATHALMAWGSGGGCAGCCAPGRGAAGAGGWLVAVAVMVGPAMLKPYRQSWHVRMNGCIWRVRRKRGRALRCEGQLCSAHAVRCAPQARAHLAPPHGLQQVVEGRRCLGHHEPAAQAGRGGARTQGRGRASIQLQGQRLRGVPQLCARGSDMLLGLGREEGQQQAEWRQHRAGMRGGQRHAGCGVRGGGGARWVSGAGTHQHRARGVGHDGVRSAGVRVCVRVCEAWRQLADFAQMSPPTATWCTTT